MEDSKKEELKYAIMASSLLGSNCWRAIRITGGECKRLKTCTFPEKKTCEAHYKSVKVIKISTKIYAREAL
jgi:hypothetical protein